MSWPAVCATALLALVLACNAQNATNGADVAGLTAFKTAAGPLPSWIPGTDPCGTQDCGDSSSGGSGTSGGSFSTSSSGEPPPPCAWGGLTCRSWRVVELRLECGSASSGRSPQLCNLGGTLAPELSQLDQLEVVSIQGQPLTGSVPPQWGSLANLTVLDLSGNGLLGTLPSSVGQLAQLRVLDLSANRLTGMLPPTLGQLTNLRLLDLSFNLFVEALPASWGGLAQLETLSVESNQLEGPLAGSWAGLAALRVLNVRDNCGICGPSPFTASQMDAGLSILSRGSSLGWSCSSSNCSAFPLGFVGQAAIVVAVVVAMVSLCCMRRCYMFRRHGRQGRRRGWGLVREVLTLQRAPRPAARDESRESDEEGGESEVPPRKVEPPIVVVMPDGSSVCTARIDPSASMSLDDPAVGGASSKGAAPGADPGSQAGTEAGDGAAAAAAVSGGAAQQAQQGQQQRSGLARWLPWRRRASSAAGAGAGASAAPANGVTAMYYTTAGAPADISNRGSSARQQEQPQQQQLGAQPSLELSTQGSAAPLLTQHSVPGARQLQQISPDSNPGAASAQQGSHHLDIPEASTRLDLRLSSPFAAWRGGVRDISGRSLGPVPRVQPSVHSSINLMSVPELQQSSGMTGRSRSGGEGRQRSGGRRRQGSRPEIPVFDLDLGRLEEGASGGRGEGGETPAPAPLTAAASGQAAST
ncbi:hypothetical protein N2152v2_004407 [Parachlorella kessleri]